MQSEHYYDQNRHVRSQGRQQPEQEVRCVFVADITSGE